MSKRQAKVLELCDEVRGAKPVPYGDLPEFASRVNQAEEAFLRYCLNIDFVSEYDALLSI